MKRTWSLYINDFGRMKDAKIVINNMMIFVGDNGSGKSYIMTLLWGLINKSTLLIEGFDISKLKYYDKCSSWLMSLKNGMGKSTINVDLQNSFVSLFNEILKLRKDTFVRNVFNGDISIGDLEIKNFKGHDIEYDCDNSGLKLTLQRILFLNVLADIMRSFVAVFFYVNDKLLHYSFDNKLHPVMPF